MAARVRDHATYEDLLNAPENMIAELVDGELYTWPRPRVKHVGANSRLGGILIPAFQFGQGGPGGWVIYGEPEIHFSPRERVLVPDLAGWRVEHAPDEDTAYITVPPDWICEIFSPSTARFDRFTKMPIYAKYNVGYAWLIDLDQRFLEAKRLENGRWTDIAIHAGNETVARIEPFDAIEIDLTRIWGRESEE
jgi:Uma2 family endonuclease